MSGVFSRKIYDDCYQNNRLNQGTKPGSYRVDNTQIQNSSCVIANGMSNSKGAWYGPNEISNVTALSDIESHLKNLDLPDSRCLEGRTMAEKNAYANSLSQNIKKTVSTCPKLLDVGNTRLENPVSDIKMMVQTRFDFPIQDPREWIYYGFSGSEQVDSNRFGINTRLQAKNTASVDYYKKLNKNI
jgi:hypothetical protein